MALVVLTVFFLWLVRGILFPFVVSFLVAALLEPAIRKLRLRGYSRTWAVALVFIAFFGVISALGLWLAPKVADQVGRLTSSVRGFSDRLVEENERANFYVRWNPAVQAERVTTVDQVDLFLTRYRSTLQRLGLPATKQAIVQQYVEPRRPQIAAFAQRVVDSFLGVLAGFATQLLFLVLIPILLWMILMDMENFKRRAPRYIPPNLRAGTITILSDIYGVFMRYLRGITSVVLLFMVATTILLGILGVPYYLLLGFGFGLLYLIPYIGNLVSLLIVLLLVGLNGITGPFGLTLGSPWVYAAIATAIFFAMGFVFDHLIYPQMVGNSVGLNGLVSMFVILCGGALFGIVGMLLAFPLAGSAKVILDRLLRITSQSSETLALPAVPLRHRSASGG